MSTTGSSEVSSTSSRVLGSRVIRLNVGGKKFHTLESTLDKDRQSHLFRLVKDQWEAYEDGLGGEIFIDRDWHHFGTILNFLRDGSSVVLPDAAGTRRELLKEAEFYRLKGLVRLCDPKPEVEVFEGDRVKWRRDVVGKYWQPFALSMILPTCHLVTDWRTAQTGNFVVVQCTRCSLSTHLDPTRFQEKEAELQKSDSQRLQKEMRLMNGVVTKYRNGSDCVMIRWDNGKEVHVPLAALHIADT